MRLDRNEKGRGKYAIVNMREIERIGGIASGKNPDIAHALRILQDNGLIEYGLPNTEHEFFVIKLKDEFSRPALIAYAETARVHGELEYARDIWDGPVKRAGIYSHWCKRPD